jgi:Asp-tRNA(Asn)/Glu-tRNA(Gln) amidotransferase A subunit family amidase
MSGVEIGLFVVGLVILLMGLWILSNRKLEYPRKPSRFYLAGIIARFVARLRTTLRRKEAAAWPNRLHLYTCDCGCHAPVLRGERPALRLLADGGVLAIPTTPGIAPKLDTSVPELEAWRNRCLGLLCIAGHAGLPQVNLPLGRVDGCPVGLSLIAGPGHDTMLLALARRLG